MNPGRDSERGADCAPRAAFALLYSEGAFSIAYDTWTGPTYLTGLAGDLKTGMALVALLTALPWLGSAGQLVGYCVYRRFPSPRHYTLVVASMARALWLVPLLSAAFWAYRVERLGTPFPTETWITLLAVVSFAVSLLGGSSGMSWMSWMKNLLPEETLGRFFGSRQRVSMAAVVAANALGAGLVGWHSHGFLAGYALLGSLAISSALVSTLLLCRVPAGASRQAKAADGAFTACPSSFSALLKPLQDAKFRRLLLFTAAFNGAVQLAGPFWPYYFTSELHIPMGLVALWSMLSSVGCFAASCAWGRMIDRAPDPRRILRLTAHLVALSPFFYIALPLVAVRWVAPFDYFTSGVASAGYTLASTALLFRLSPEGQGASAYFCLNSALGGLAGAVCAFLGGHLVVWLAHLGGFRALFLLSGCARLTVTWALLGALATPRLPRAGRVWVQTIHNLARARLLPSPAGMPVPGVEDEGLELRGAPLPAQLRTDPGARTNASRNRGPGSRDAGI